VLQLVRQIHSVTLLIPPRIGICVLQKSAGMRCCAWFYTSTAGGDGGMGIDCASESKAGEEFGGVDVLLK